MAEAFALERRRGFRLAAVMARRGVMPAMIGEALGIAIDEGPRVSGNSDLKLIGTGSGSWLALGDAAGPEFAAQLSFALDGLAALSDQSSGYAIHRLSGPGARTILQRGVAIDLHPSAFAPRSAATTVIAHIGVVLWQVDDRPAYDVATFRSYDESFRHWLEQAAATL